MDKLSTRNSARHYNTGVNVQRVTQPAEKDASSVAITVEQKNTGQVKDVRKTPHEGSNPGASGEIVNVQSETAREVRGGDAPNPEHVKKTTEILQKIKDNLKHVDVKVDKNDILIKKPFFMGDDRIPIRDGKKEEARTTVDNLMKKFKGGQNPNENDAINVLSVVDPKKMLGLMG
jgi:hypothetical protein